VASPVCSIISLPVFKSTPSRSHATDISSTPTPCLVAQCIASTVQSITSTVHSECIACIVHGAY
jgi:hypothetical protein